MFEFKCPEFQARALTEKSTVGFIELREKKPLSAHNVCFVCLLTCRFFTERRGRERFSIQPVIEMGFASGPGLNF